MNLSKYFVCAATVCVTLLAHMSARAQAAMPQYQTADSAAAVPSPALSYPPRILSDTPSCRPEMPPAAIRLGVTGTSGVRLTVSASGQISQAEITRSSGPTREHRLLDRAALEALSRCPFVPGRDGDGHPVGGAVDLTFTWSLDHVPQRVVPLGGTVISTGPGPVEFQSLGKLLAAEHSPEWIEKLCDETTPSDSDANRSALEAWRVRHTEFLHRVENALINADRYARSERNERSTSEAPKDQWAKYLANEELDVRAQLLSLGAPALPTFCKKFSIWLDRYEGNVEKQYATELDAVQAFAKYATP